MQPGKRNSITDVAGFRVGNATDQAIKTGSTVLVGSEPFCAAVHVMGGAPGTRETDLLAPDRLVQKVDAMVLSGGSAFGLDAASGVMNVLAKQGRGYVVEDKNIPIVPRPFCLIFSMVAIRTGMSTHMVSSAWRRWKMPVKAFK